MIGAPPSGYSRQPPLWAQRPVRRETAQATSQVRHPIQRLGSAITKLFIERDPKWFVTPDRPHPPGRRQRGLPPQGIYQTNTGRWPVIKSQVYENKWVIWMVKAVFAVADERDEGAGPLIGGIIGTIRKTPGASYYLVFISNPPASSQTKPNDNAPHIG